MSEYRWKKTKNMGTMYGLWKGLSNTAKGFH